MIASHSNPVADEQSDTQRDPKPNEKFATNRKVHPPRAAA